MGAEGSDPALRPRADVDVEPTMTVNPRKAAQAREKLNQSNSSSEPARPLQGAPMTPSEHLRAAGFRRVGGVWVRPGGLR